MPADKKKILLVEDDPMIVDMYKIRLEEDGFEVYVTDKGSEALKIAEKENPDLVLLDIILPEIDGFAVLQLLKEDVKTKKIPVIMLTNLGQEGDRQKGLSFGAADYFVKAQLTPANVITAVKKLIK